MTPTRQRTAIAVIIAAVVVSTQTTAQTRRDVQPNAISLDALMQRKLTGAQRLLEGLALEDYELIEREAQTLEVLALDARWNTVQTEEYQRYGAEFRDLAGKLRKAGAEENLDAAGLSYLQLNMTCIACHRHVRRLDKSTADSADSP